MFIKSIVAFFVALIICLLAYPKVIPFLRKIKYGQSIRLDGPQSHLKKSGTPTMGGIVFVLSSIVAVSLVNLSAYKNIEFVVIILCYIGYGLIGFLDDYLIVVKKNNDGLKASYKFALQSLLAVLFFVLYQRYGDNTISLPFTSITVDLKILYFVLAFFMLTGTSNAVNLTDGLDGLCAGMMIIALVPFGYFAYQLNKADIVILISSVIGSLVGYLKFNHNPAQIFMGDTGSLALGAMLAAIAIATKKEIALIVIGGVFVAEAVSVILQVGTFKLTGKRIFKMAPLHHHFELCGYKETKITKAFWLTGIILAIIGLIMGVLG